MQPNHSVRFLLTLLLAGGVFASSQASAQGPDIRSIRPHVMLLVDTSGSMEYLPDCSCRTPSCSECLPSCGAAQRNRWATVVEALTGSYSAFSCTRENRTEPAYIGQYDFFYYLPHHRLPLVGQANDGLLDVYADRVRFGLMTFDGIGTLQGYDALVPRVTFETPAFLSASAGTQGQFSYGTRRPFSIPGCPTTFMIDNGAQNSSASGGRLISVGSDSLDPVTINAQIQSAVLSVRPFGPTPIAGMLDDARYFLQTDPDVRAPSAGGTDAYAACRDRYLILLTDGVPNAEMRDSVFRCDAPGGSCPYQRSEEIAADLCRFDPSSAACTGSIDGLFVVGFDVGEPATLARLNDIAAAGGTGSAYFANDRASLMSKLALAVDRAAPGTTTRTTPSFGTFGSSFTGGQQGQMQFQSGFKIPGGGTPWYGVLERSRFECDGTLTPVLRDIDDTRGDRFHKVLNDRNLGSSPRQLLTVIPSTTAARDSTLIGEYASVTAEPFTVANARVTRNMLGVTSSARRDEIIRWIHGEPGTRDGRRLGDIYHSSPQTVSPPSADIADESYNIWRQDPRVSLRPSVLYVGTNDGIMHAFATEDHRFLSGPYAGRTLSAGSELWGFIPPILLGKLDAATTSHQLMWDGTPTIRDVYLYREASDSAALVATRWRTVMVSGLRGGAKGFVALDVTDPLAPKFLWQFAHPDLGYTYGRPAIAQVIINFGGRLQERAVAILPGGTGEIDTTRTTGPIGCPANGIGMPPVTDGTTTARSNQRCWNARTGRQTFVVDIQTGQVIRHFDHRIFNAPLTGAISAFQGDVATLATRAFVTDHDGVMWRLDLSSRNPAAWSATPFHDIFWDGEATRGQPGYDPPMVTVDDQGQIVVIQASGDIDALDGSAANRVVSLTEVVTRDSSGAILSARTRLNWEIRLESGEQVTGPLDLFEGKIYFASFRSVASAADACQFGQSRIWGVEYLLANPGSPMPVPRPGLPGASPGSLVSYLGPYDNQIILGVAVTKRPACFTGVTETDPYFGGSRYRITASGGGGFELVAQVSGRSGVSAGGAEVDTIRTTLPMPASFSDAYGVAGILE